MAPCLIWKILCLRNSLKMKANKKVIKLHFITNLRLNFKIRLKKISLVNLCVLIKERNNRITMISNI